MNINYETISHEKKSGEILKNEIKNIKVFYRRIEKNEVYKGAHEESYARIIILSGGEININGNILKNRGISAFLPDYQVDILGIEDSLLIEVCVKTDVSMADKSKLPYFLDYEDAVQYKEDCKSEKTINRFLLKQRIIPDIAIGSVETYGPDRVGEHTHPDVEQLFFGFSENDMVLLIDGEEVSMPGNTLVHIPLGSNHGVIVREGQCAHYVWMDYVINPKGLEYLDMAHETE